MKNNVLSLKDAFIYQNDNLVLSDVNLELHKGEFIYLIGKTGSGKSSLMKLLYGDLELLEGKGEIVSFDLSTLKEKDIPNLRRRIGIVFQDFKLLNDRSVMKNLLFVLKATGWKRKREMIAKAEQVLEKVGMKNKSHKMPYELSGGEQQRVAIARALLNDPEIILADEPTGNLDPITSAEVIELLQQIYLSGKTVVMATHDFGLIVKYPHKTYKVEAGKLFEINQES
ncbi:cell division ATP-binding protein FtsE [Aureivirga marina]|uniref:cell division ATP-binding protein FtsE n=1 Tax=Aureivirga marina TaxID=1182451 RepID=UPI0018CB1E19|nr:ATP-binding cassette domain-containing protein [Aureivirga marina]